jgi:hypothetical protein
MARNVNEIALGQIDFSENLHAKLFNDDLSNEPTFSQIHLAGQYL